MPIDENGQASLVRDLLKLPRTFTYRRYRIDIVGFFVAWLAVAIFIAFYYWLSKW